MVLIAVPYMPAAQTLSFSGCDAARTLTRYEPADWVYGSLTSGTYISTAFARDPVVRVGIMSVRAMLAALLYPAARHPLTAAAAAAAFASPLGLVPAFATSVSVSVPARGNGAPPRLPLARPRRAAAAVLALAAAALPPFASGSRFVPLKIAMRGAIYQLLILDCAR